MANSSEWTKVLEGNTHKGSQSRKLSRRAWKMKLLRYSALREATLTAIAISSLYGCASGGVETPAGDKAIDTFAVFESGNARLSCEFSCSYTWGAARRHARVLYNFGSWADLAAEVLRVGYNTDQTYFYLGRSAEGLGKSEVSKIYYKLALEAEVKCDGIINNCDGLEIQKLITKTLSNAASQQEKISQQNDRDSTKNTQNQAVLEKNQKIPPPSQDAEYDQKQSSYRSIISGEEIHPITVSMWGDYIPANRKNITTEWVLEELKRISVKSRALAKDKKRSEWLTYALRSSVLSEYYVELESLQGDDEVGFNLKNGREILKKLGIPQSFFDESLKNLKVAMPMEGVITSHSIFGTVFGLKLGKTFSMPECELTNYGYSAVPNRTCFEYVANRVSDISLKTGYVSIQFPYEEKPDVVYGADYYALLVGGVLEGVSFDTGGIRRMDFVFEELKDKYGDPSKKTTRVVRNIYGATFDITDAVWVKNNTSVIFIGAGSSIDSGTVKIFTKNGLKYTEKINKELTKENKL